LWSHELEEKGKGTRGTRGGENRGLTVFCNIGGPGECRIHGRTRDGKFSATKMIGETELMSTMRHGKR